MFKRLCVLLAFLVAGAAHADLVYRNGLNELRILKEEWRDKFKKSRVTIGEATIYSCWWDSGEGMYVIILEDGHLFGVPVESFIEVPGV